LRNYTRWRKAADGALIADILGSKISITADPMTGEVLHGNVRLTPDEARMYGVRLVEAAALADGERAIRGTE
jgi:hypothetical protein